MTTINQVYENAGTLIKFNRKVYEPVRRRIEKLVMEERKYNWREKATDEFFEEIFRKEEK